MMTMEMSRTTVTIWMVLPVVMMTVAVVVAIYDNCFESDGRN